MEKKHCQTKRFILLRTTAKAETKRKKGRGSTHTPVDYQGGGLAMRAKSCPVVPAGLTNQCITHPMPESCAKRAACIDRSIDHTRCGITGEITPPVAQAVRYTHRQPQRAARPTKCGRLTNAKINSRYDCRVFGPKTCGYLSSKGYYQ